jgi:phage terminase large subunit
MSAPVTLPHLFSPRSTQRPVFEYFDQGGTRAVVVAHRRFGKDATAFNWIIRELWRTPGLEGFYILPTFTQAKRVMWTGLTDQRRRMLDFIPRAIIKTQNENELRIVFHNGSQLTFVGSEQLDALMGTNPSRLVFSEYALQRPDAWDFLRPILAQNGGKALFIGTPRGRNHLWQLFAHAERDPSWYAVRLTVADTARDAAGEDGAPVIAEAAIDKERLEGMPEPLVQQEFYCSFAQAVSGAVYGPQMAAVEAEGRVRPVPHDPSRRVVTAWDIGRGTTAILFAQAVHETIHLIDYAELQQDDLAAAVKLLQSKPYVYAGRHIGPHDLEHEEWGAGRSRLATARQLGISFRVVPRTSIDEGVHAARMLLPRCVFDEGRTAGLVACLQHYEREWDEVKKILAVKPRADWTTHGSDAFRYLAMAWRDGLDAGPRERKDYGPSKSTWDVFNRSRY